MFWDARVIRLHPFRVRDDKVARGLLSILTRMWQGRHGQEAEAAPGQLDQALLESERANAIPNEGPDLTEVLCTVEISEAIWNRCRNQYAGVRGEDMNRARSPRSRTGA
jgi:hypothetical protein